MQITNGNAEIEAGFESYRRELLGYGASLRDLFEVADTNPQCALINANAAALHLAFEGREGWDLAAPYLDRMTAQCRGLSDEEAEFCAAVSAWAQRDFYQAQAHLLALARRWPDNLIAIKWGQYHAFNLGDQQGLLELGDLAVSANPGQPYVHGLHAFALEQNHRLRDAEREAMRAVEIAIDDAWAHHAAAHVMETERRAADGAVWLAHCAHLWETKGIFIREHNWWHAALFHLALGDHEKVLEIYDHRLWGEWPEFPQEQIGAASMLWRLELHGVDTGERWRPLIAQARQHADDHLFPFHDLHYLFALCRTGNDREAEQYLADMRQRASGACSHTAAAWQKGGVPAAAGILAFARSDYVAAITELESALPYLGRIGGSHAQRAIFAETLAAARRHAGRSHRALGE